MNSICVFINALDFRLGGLLFLNWVQHRARSDSRVTLACRGLTRINCALLPDVITSGTCRVPGDEFGLRASAVGCETLIQPSSGNAAFEAGADLGFA